MKFRSGKSRQAAGMSAGCPYSGMSAMPCARPLWTQMLLIPGISALSFRAYLVISSNVGYATSSSSCRHSFMTALVDVSSGAVFLPVPVDSSDLPGWAAWVMQYPFHASGRWFSTWYWMYSKFALPMYIRPCAIARRDPAMSLMKLRAFAVWAAVRISAVRASSTLVTGRLVPGWAATKVVTLLISPTVTWVSRKMLLMKRRKWNASPAPFASRFWTPEWGAVNAFTSFTYLFGFARYSAVSALFQG